MKKQLWNIAAATLFIAAIVVVATQSSAQPPANKGAKKKTPQGKKKATPAVEEKDPVVLTIRESNPQTPQELMRALQVMINIKRADEGKVYLQRLMQRNLNATQLAALQSKFGSGFFFKLLRNSDYAPEGQQLAKAVMKASFEASRNPAVIQRAISQLASTDRLVHSRALDTLEEGREPAVVALITALQKVATTNNERQAKGIRDALVHLKRTAQKPLLATLTATEPKFLAQVIITLERMRSRDSVPLLLYSATSPKSPAALKATAQRALQTLIGGRVTLAQAQGFLYRQSLKSFRNSLPGLVAKGTTAEIVWEWQAAQKSVKVRFEEKRIAAVVDAYRMARDAYRLDETNAKHRQVYLATLLELAKLRVGSDRKLPRQEAFTTASRLGVAAVMDALEFCVANRHIPGALAATEVIGAIGKADLLETKSGSTSPLAMVVQDKDRRLRYQGAMAIAALDPQQSFAGASHVTNVLSALLRTRGVRRALVAHPKVAKAQDLVALLNEVGYQADKATDARTVYNMATKEQDYDLIVVSDMVQNPRPDELAQMLRQDIRTSSTPLGILARETTFRRLKIQTEKDRLTVVLALPNSARSMQQQVQLLLARAGINAVDADERVLQAADALKAVATLMKNHNRVFHLRRLEPAVIQATYAPQLSAQACAILGKWASPNGQKTLLELATNENRALSDRAAAATAFVAAVKARGLVVTSTDVRSAQRRIQRATKLDPQSQRVVGQVMSVISTVAAKNGRGAP